MVDQPSDRSPGGSGSGPPKLAYEDRHLGGLPNSYLAAPRNRYMICWHCHWGWAKPVKAIYLRALAELDGDDWALECGPAHVVWSDENWDCAESCIAHFEKYAGELSEHERKVVMRSLTELAALPLAIRDPCPEDYDGEHPELFPPAKNVEMVAAP